MKDSIMKYIPVVFGIDKTYILQVFVVMHSILRNSNQQYHFFILTKDEVAEQADELSKSLKKYYTNFCYTIQKINEQIFNDVSISNRHIVQATFYRLLIPELIYEYEKCIYLDADIIVNNDLEELFKIDIEGSYIAGVKDCHLISKNTTQHQKGLGIPSVENYINAGVLLLNLKKLREDNISKKFLQQVKKRNKYEDQDVLNLCCYGSIKILPIGYNLFHFYKGKTIKFLFDLDYQKKEFLFNWSNPFILHMGWIYKPWLKKRYKGSKEWWNLAEVFKDSECYKVCRENCQWYYDEIKKIKNVFRICREHKHIILWGFSEQGKDVCDIFLRRGISIYAFCDNDIKKIGKRYKEIPVLTVTEVLKTASDVFWIITCKNSYEEVYNQLYDLNVKMKNIEHFVYNNREKMYYLALDPEYYTDEIEKIALLEKNMENISDKQYLEFIQQIIIEADFNNEEYRYLYYKYRFDLWLKS